MSRASKKEFGAPDYDNITDALIGLYDKKIKALEKACCYDVFTSACLSPSELQAKPMVLLLGQYSVGKTSFIRWMIGKDFPGQLIGPEPTTESFMALCPSPAGVGDRSIPGAAAAADTSRPYCSLSDFGSNFLGKFSISQIDGCPLLDHVSLVDTPGVLAGQKQTEGRKYDFERVVGWFAERADLILVLLDAYKLDVSDEFMKVIRGIQMHDEKIRLVLNKADQVGTPELLRVSQAMSWSMAKVLRTPEVKRTYISSFWEHEIKETPLKDHMLKERELLLADLKALTGGKLQRRINEFVRRTRFAYTHALIIEHLRSSSPFTGKDAWAAETLAHLDLEWAKVAKKNSMHVGDLPGCLHYKNVFSGTACDLTKLPASAATATKLKEAIDEDIPALLRHFQHEVEGVDYVPEPAREMRGELFKAGTGQGMMKIGSGFKKRWCVLENQVLTYYAKEPTGAEDEPKGALNLLGATAKPKAGNPQSWSFGITGPQLDREYIVAATSGDQMSKWMRQIDAHGAADPPTSASGRVLSPPTEDNDD